MTVTATMAEMPRVRIRIDYEVTLKGKVITTGHSTHAFMSRDAQAIKPPPIVTERIR